MLSYQLMSVLLLSCWVVSDSLRPTDCSTQAPLYSTASQNLLKFMFTECLVVVWSLVAKLCPNLTNPWTVACQVPLFMEFSRQEYWSGLPCPSPGDLPDPGIKPRSPALQADSLPSDPPGKPSLSAYPVLNSSHVFFHLTPLSSPCST